VFTQVTPAATKGYIKYNKQTKRLQPTTKRQQIMTIQIKLTSSQVQSLNKKQALQVAKELEIIGRHDMTKVQLLQAIEEALSQPEDDQEIQADLWEQPQKAQETQAILVTSSESYSPQREHLENCLSQKLLAPAEEPKSAKASKKSKKPKAPKKPKAQPLTALENLSPEVISEVQELYKVTAETCSDPGRLVVNRQHLFDILAAHWNQPLSTKIINQLVVLASRKLARQPLTINSSGSRFKYLLAETNKGHTYPVCLEILEYLWDKPQLLQVAQGNYKVASQTGLEFVQNR
jgi:hypothetical protein